MNVYQRIKKICDSKHLTIAAVEVSAGISNGSIGKWKTQMPKADNLYSVTKVLGKSVEYFLTGIEHLPTGSLLEDDQHAIIDYYNRLTPEYRDYIKGKMVELYRSLDAYPAADAQAAQNIVPLFHVQADEQESDFVRELPVYEACASAGTGQPIDMSRFENVPVGDEVPLNANFGVPLAGNSMEPAYPDGSIVWVKQQRTLEDGQIGIFYWDGQMYCKQFRKTKSGIALVSLNRDYRTILIDDTGELVCYGRVVAVSEPT